MGVRCEVEVRMWCRMGLAVVAVVVAAGVVPAVPVEIVVGE